ncbi:hypothetical protein CRG98_006595 [Punica granatum]|uniref:Uncharacterized protein n=1 Tax=Punica granatum TaxID=22663 RepID=A0A2I0KX00_PUNGR|nr:hypothetical protein CRG98_006595 [Punica granatum]
MGRTYGLDLRSKGNGPRPIRQRAVGIGGSGGDEAAGCGSRPWTPRRRHERAREMALGTAWAARCPIWTSPGSKRLESRGKVAFSDFDRFWRKLRKSAIWGVPGRWGSRAAGERCPALPGLLEDFFFQDRRFTGSR